MFCSNCGKTIPPEAVECPHCGAYLGEDCFAGSMYTSAQTRVPVDEAENTPSDDQHAYTRTDYMSYDNQSEDDLYSGTTYRPILTDQEDEGLTEEEYVPEDVNSESSPEEADEAPSSAEEAAAPEEEAVSEEAAVPEEEAAPEPQDELPEEEAPVDIPADDIEEEEEESVSPLPEIPERAISPSVKHYMEEYESRKKAREEAASRGSLWQKLSSPFNRSAAPENESAEEEPAEDIPGMENAEEYAEEYVDETESSADEPADNTDDILPGNEETVPEEEAGEALPDEAGQPEYGYADDGSESSGEGEETYETAFEEEMPYDEEESLGEKKPFRLDLSLFKNKKVQIALGAVLAVIILICGIRWISYVATNLGTRISGVTRGTYSDGIKLITEYTSEEYRSKLIETGTVNQAYAQQLMAEDMISINALMPAEPEENDELFITTLTIIHNAAQKTIMADADAARTGTTEARSAASAQEWSLISGAVTSLSNATSVAQLSAIATDIQSALMPTATPAPAAPTAPAVTPTPAPTTLKEGMKDNAAVEKVQARLIELGYLTGSADGDFGPMTTAAVKAFQKAAAVEENGIVDEALQDLLFADDAPKAETAS